MRTRDGTIAEAYAAAKEVGTTTVLVVIGPGRARGKKHVEVRHKFGTKFAPPHPYMRPT
jgi:hypothetical protein